jgi:ureidoacrylate peracid hydrolase
MNTGFIPQKGRVLTLEERLDPRSTALVVVDVQNDFCHPDGAFGRPGADVSMMPDMAANLRRLIEAARRRAVLILWVRATYDAIVTSDALAETYNRRGFTRSQCLEGSWGAEWYGVQPAEAANEVVLTKHRFSPFWDTAIDLYLRSNDIRSIVLTGVVTSGCVESTARDAFVNDYYVVVVEDCVAEASRKRHLAALQKLAQTFGTVWPSAQIVSAWDASSGRAVSWQFQTKRVKQLRDRSARLDPAHTALILVDTQDAAFGQVAVPADDLASIRATVSPIAALLQQARAHRVLVVHIRTEHAEAAMSDVQLHLQERAPRPDACGPATSRVGPCREIVPVCGEPVLSKHRFDAFIDTGLEKLLRVNRIRTLVIAGAETQCAIDTTVRHAVMLDFYVVVPEYCVAAKDRLQHLHHASLETIAQYFADVCGWAEIVGCWRGVALPVSGG